MDPVFFTTWIRIHWAAPAPTGGCNYKYPINTARLWIWNTDGSGILYNLDPDPDTLGRSVSVGLVKLVVTNYYIQA